MQIYQITQPSTPKKIDEGLLDAIKRPFKTSDRAMQDTGGAKSKDAYRVHAVAEKAQRYWDDYRKRYAGSIRDEQERADYLSGRDGLMEKQLVSFVELNFLGKQPIESFANGDRMMSIIRGIVHTDEQSAKKPTPNARATQPSGVQPNKAVAPAQQPQAQPTPNQKPVISSNGTQLVSDNPRIMRAGGKDWILDDKGRWANAKTFRPAPESYQVFLDKEDAELDKLFALREDVADKNPKEYNLFVDLIRQASMASKEKHGTRSSGQGSVLSVAKDMNREQPQEIASTGNKLADAVLKSAGFNVV